MGFVYKQTRRAAYLPAVDASPWIGRYKALPFPEQWRGHLLDLCNARRSKDAEPLRTVPTWRMDGVLQSLAPDLIVRGRSGEYQGQEPDYWLYLPADLPNPIPDTILKRLLTAWARDLCPEEEHRNLVHDTVRDLHADLPPWHENVNVDLLDCPRTDGGTAAPHGQQLQLTTDALARRILELKPYDFRAGTLEFRAAPRGPRDQGAELISQPLPHVKKDLTWWYSVTINITLHTVPFSPLPRLHFHTGIRRWATHPGTNGRLRLPYGRATSVFLRPSIPWVHGAPPSDRYALAHLCWLRDQRRYGWRETGPAGILRDVSLSQPFPDPEALLSAPADWLGDGPGVGAGIVHSTHMGKHEVGTGLMPQQRSEIIAWAEQAVPEYLVRAPDLNRSTIAPNPPANARPKPTSAEGKRAQAAREAHARRAALAIAIRESGDQPTPANQKPILRARLLWQTPAMRDTAISELADILGLESDGGPPSGQTTDNTYQAARPGEAATHRWDTPELEVELRCLPLTGGMADSLGVDPTATPKWEALNSAVSARRTLVTQYLHADEATPENPTLALVEIDRRADFSPPRDDPKFALRLGCADAGVLTQFMHVPKKTTGHNTEKNKAERAHSSWKDGLRQLGVRVMPEDTLGKRLPDDLRYAAVWMVKRRKDGPTRIPRHVPVAVMTSPLDLGSGQAIVTGWDDELRTWIPYPRFLLRMTRKAEIPETAPDDAETGEETEDKASENSGSSTRVPRRVWKQEMEEQRKETQRFLQRVLRSLGSASTVLLTASQNSRLHWPWLQDANAMRDLIKTGHAPPSRLKSNLRLVRVRTAQGKETPQWWGIGHPSGVNGLPAGLWTEPERPGHDSRRVFYSTTSKPETFKHSAVEADKLAPRPKRSGDNLGVLTIDTDKPAWNPALVEIAVLGCHTDQSTPPDEAESDSPEALALAVHQLRQAPDYHDALTLPLPLHLAALAQQYVLPTIADDTGDDTGETADTTTPTSGKEEPFSDVDPELFEAPGPAQAPNPAEQLTLFSQTG